MSSVVFWVAGFRVAGFVDNDCRCFYYTFLFKALGLGWDGMGFSWSACCRIERGTVVYDLHLMAFSFSVAWRCVGMPGGARI